MRRILTSFLSGSSLTANQISGFGAAWGGLVLDGMDSFIYALVLVPAMRDLLPVSGMQPNPGNLGRWQHSLFGVPGRMGSSVPLGTDHRPIRAAFAPSWWPFCVIPLSPFLGCLAQNIWQFGFFRILAGFGVGGEFVAEAIFVAEEMPDHRRVSGAGLLNSGFYVGTFIAAALNYLIGSHYGWRSMFAVGGVPAVFIAFIRYGAHEPERHSRP